MSTQPGPSRPDHFVGATEMASTEFLLYHTEDGQARIEVRMVGENVWLSLTQLAELFGRDKSVISRHIKNIYDEGDVGRDATVAVLATVQPEGERQVQRETEHYNLDVIISVGYRVKFLRTSERDILTDLGRVSNDEALKSAHLQYERFRQARLQLPSPVEQHLAKAASKTKRLGQALKGRRE